MFNLNSNKDCDNEETQKLLEINHLKKILDAKIAELKSRKTNLELLDEKIIMNKKLVNNSEKKLEELMTEIEDTKWKQTKAKFILTTHNEFVENFKKKMHSNSSNDVNINKTVDEELLQSKIMELKIEKETLEFQCTENDRIFQEMHNKFQSGSK